MRQMKVKYFMIVLMITSLFLGTSSFASEKGIFPQNASYSDTTKNNTLNRLTPAQKLCYDVVSQIEVPTIDYTPPAPPSNWTTGVLTQMGLSQVSLTNWAEGGSATIALNAYIDGNANYAKNKMIWENRIKIAYGFIQSFDKDKPFKQQYKKSEDKLNIDSKWGYSFYDRLYASASVNFRTQLTAGFDNSGTTPKLLSSFMAPGYLSLGLGIDYKPLTFLSINFSPATGNFIVVSIPELRKKFGNNEDQAVRSEFGAQLKLDMRFAYKTFKLGTQVTLFSDYLHNPQNIQVYWDFDASWAIRKFLTLSLRTNLIYDDNIKIADKNGVEAPRVQFKEIVSLNFAYTIGKYQKGK